MTFEEWYSYADKYCISKIGLSVRDLPDTRYCYDYYDEYLLRYNLWTMLLNMFKIFLKMRVSVSWVLFKYGS